MLPHTHTQRGLKSIWDAVSPTDQEVTCSVICPCLPESHCIGLRVVIPTALHHPLTHAANGRKHERKRKQCGLSPETRIHQPAYLSTAHCPATYNTQCCTTPDEAAGSPLQSSALCLDGAKSSQGGRLKRHSNNALQCIIWCWHVSCLGPCSGFLVQCC